MSLTVDPIQAIRVDSTVQNLDEKVYMGVNESSPSIVFREFRASSDSNSSSNYSIDIPKGVILDRHLFHKVRVQLDFVGTSTTGVLLNQGYDAFRQFPIAQAKNVESFTINGTAFSGNVSEYILELMKYDKLDEIQEESMTPIMPDQSQQYSDLVASQRSPLNTFANSTGWLVPPRGAFNILSFTNNEQDAQIIAEFVEPVFVSPFLYGKTTGKGMYNLDSLDATVTWNANLAKAFWSHVGDGSAVSTINNIDVTILESSYLTKLVSPSSLQVLPAVQQFNYELINVRPTDISGALVAGATSAPQVTNTISLSSVPSHFMVAIKEKKANRSFLNCDAYASIENVSIYMMNDDGMMSSANKQQLYRTNKFNGYQPSYQEFSGEPMYSPTALGDGQVNGLGGPLLLRVGQDIAVRSPELASGSAGNFDFQLTVTYTNRSARNIEYSIYVYPVWNGVATVWRDQCISQLGVLSKEQVLNALADKNAPSVDMGAVDEGGNFFKGFSDKLKRALPSVIKGIRFGRQAVQKYGPLIGPALGPEALPYQQSALKIADALQSVGLGEGGVMTAGPRKKKATAKKATAKKSAPKKSAPRGRPRKYEPYCRPTRDRGKGVLIGGEGGELMTRSEMQRRLMNY